MKPLPKHSVEPQRTPSRSRRALMTIGAALAVAPWGVGAAETIELKVSHYLPPNHTIHKELLQWADDLARKSGGRLKLTIFPSGQMGPITRQYDLARTGVSDVSYFMHGSMPGRFPLTELAQLPYAFNPDTDAGLRSPLSVAKASAVATSLAARLAKEHEGTRILYVIAQPNLSLFLNKQKVVKPDDLKGMRLRHNGPMPAKMIAAWGATPAAVAPVELADALEKGTVNGMTFNYEAAQSFQLGPAVKQVTEINAYAVTFALVMNSKKYDALPADLRQLIDESTGPGAASRVGAKYDEAEALGRKYLIANKTEIYVPTSEDAKTFRAPVMPLIEDAVKAAEDKGLSARQFFSELRNRVNTVKP